VFNIFSWGFGSYDFDVILRYEARNRDGVDRSWAVLADKGGPLGVYLLSGESQTVINPGDVFHLVLTMDFGTNNYSLYVNGALVDTSTASISQPPLVSVSIGSESSAGVWTWEGEIQDVRVHNRVLAPGEVLDAYIHPWDLYRVPEPMMASAAGGLFEFDQLTGGMPDLTGGMV
jgi:hypothetical protein